MEPPLQWRAQDPRPATPTNGTVGLAGDTSRLYKWVGFVGAAHSPAAPSIAICRAAGDGAASTNARV